MHIRRMRGLVFSVVITAISVTASTVPVHAGLVPLQQATATFSQAGLDIANILNSNPSTGWAILTIAGTAAPETAVVETVTDLGFGAGTALTFTLDHFSGFPEHGLGRFRISLTTDDRSTFADGLQSGCDVTAAWTILDPLTFSASSGATITKLGDMSLLLSGINPGINPPTATETYTITAQTALTGITGFRLEAMTDASLPGNGPGRAGNSNFVLTQFSVMAVSRDHDPNKATLSRSK